MIQTANRLETVQEYYFSKKLREVRELMADGRPIINMGIGSPDLAPSAAVIDTVKDDDRYWCTSISKLPGFTSTT